MTWPSGLPATPSDSVLRPSPTSARLVQFSCQRLLVVEPHFAGAFHQQLCALAPESGLPHLATGGQLSAALAHVVLWAALSDDEVTGVEAAVRAFGADHRARGFPDAAYPGLGHALLRSVRSTLPAGWTSELSSGWVAYTLWLQPQLERGAVSRPVPPPGTGTAGQPDVRGPAPVSLDTVLAELRARHFPQQNRAFDAVCTRVGLRTGADLRAPRPDQRTDPQVIAHVVESLLLMGYAVTVPDVVPAAPAVRPPPGPAPAAPETPHGSRSRLRPWRRYRNRGDGPDRDSPRSLPR
ncbi:MAG: hypothetical protein P8Z68_07320 [Kineosporiaceae bacterium]